MVFFDFKLNQNDCSLKINGKLSLFKKNNFPLESYFLANADVASLFCTRL